MGGRTTLLGGTGVVYGMDGASVFMNPATALRTDPGRLSFSVNFYAGSYMSAPNWYRPGPVDEGRFGPLDAAGTSASDLSLHSLPSSLCLFFRIGRLPWFKKSLEKNPQIRDARLGLCLATTQTETFNFAGEDYSGKSSSGVVGRQSQNISQNFRRFQFGPTYSMTLLPGLNIGAAIHGSIASHASSFTALSQTSEGSLAAPIHSLFHSSSHGTSWQMHAIAGATYTFHGQSIGVAVEAPSVHLFGSGGATYYAQSDAVSNRSLSITGEGTFDVQNPARLSLGTGIERRWGTAELDVTVFAPMANAYRANLDVLRTNIEGGKSATSPESIDLSQRARGVVNVGVGTEIYVSKTLSLLSGLSTDLSAVSKGELRKNIFNYYPARTNRIAASFGIGSHRNDGDLILGTELSYGWGERLAINSYAPLPELATTPHQTIGILFVIAGTTTFRAISRAVEDVTNAVTNPGKPSQEYVPKPTPQQGPAMEPPPRVPSNR